MSQDARRAVMRELHKENYSHRTHWMIRPPKISFAMIRISYVIADCDGDPLMVKTWAVGATAKAALRSWLTSHPALGAKDIEHTIVTESKVSAPVGRPGGMA